MNDSSFTADVLGNLGTIGGTISLDPEFIIIKNSVLSATALFGAGGTVDLTADVILIDLFTTIDVSSQFGTSGTVTVSSPVQNLSGAIAPLPQEILKVASLYGARCVAQKGGAFSSFTQSGGGGLPPQPGNFLPSPLPFIDLGGLRLRSVPPIGANLTTVRLGLVPVLAGCSV